jgi:hypothetical protein
MWGHGYYDFRYSYIGLNDQGPYPTGWLNTFESQIAANYREELIAGISSDDTDQSSRREKSHSVTDVWVKRDRVYLGWANRITYGTLGFAAYVAGYAYNN